MCSSLQAKGLTDKFTFITFKMLKYIINVSEVRGFRIPFWEKKSWNFGVSFLCVSVHVCGSISLLQRLMKHSSTAAGSRVAQLDALPPCPLSVPVFLWQAELLSLITPGC